MAFVSGSLEDLISTGMVSGCFVCFFCYIFGCSVYCILLFCVVSWRAVLKIYLNRGTGRKYLSPTAKTFLYCVLSDIYFLFYSYVPCILFIVQNNYKYTAIHQSGCKSLRINIMYAHYYVWKSKIVSLKFRTISGLNVFFYIPVEL